MFTSVINGTDYCIKLCPVLHATACLGTAGIGSHGHVMLAPFDTEHSDFYDCSKYDPFAFGDSLSEIT